MLKRDYLLREVERFSRAMGEVLASVIGARKGGTPHQAFEEADQALADETDIPLVEILEKPPGELLDLVVHQWKMAPEHMEILADILIELAESSRRDGARNLHEDPLALLEKARIMLDFAVNHDELYSFERAAKLDRLTQQLD